MEEPNSSKEKTNSQLKAALKAQVAKNKLLKGELEKSIQNTQTLDEAMRTRTEMIMQLTAEKEKYMEISNEAQERLSAKDQQIQQITSLLEQKNQECESLTETNNQIVIEFNTERTKTNQELIHIREQLEIANRTNMQLSQDLSAALEEYRIFRDNSKEEEYANQIIKLNEEITLLKGQTPDMLDGYGFQLGQEIDNAMQMENDQLKQLNAQLVEQLNILRQESDNLKQSIVSNDSESKSLEQTCAALQEKCSNMENEFSQKMESAKSHMQNLVNQCQAKESIINELQIKNAQAQSEISTLKQQLKNLPIAMSPELKAIEEAQEQIRQEKEKNDQIRETLMKFRDNLRKEQAKAEQEMMQFRQEKVKFEDLVRQEKEKKFDIEQGMKELKQQKNEVLKLKAEQEEEIKTLSSLRDATEAEERKLERTKEEFGDIDEQYQNLQAKIQEYHRNLAEFNENNRKFQKDKYEAAKILQTREKLQADLEVYEKEYMEFQSKRAIFNTEYEEFELSMRKNKEDTEKLNAMKEQLEQTENKVKDKLSIINEKERLLANFEKEKESIEQQRKLHSSLNEAKAQIKKLSSQNLILDKQMKEALHKIKALKLVRKTLKLHIRSLKSEANPQVQSPYLKKVILQFFTQDSSTRETLAPIILNLIGCDNQELNLAMRSWTGNKNGKWALPSQK